MNYRADCFGQQIDRAAKNISADGGAGSNASDARGSERGEMPVHRGKTRLEVSNGTLPKSKFVAEIPAGQSEGAGENFGGSGNGAGGGAADLARIPEGVRDSVLSRSGEYDARRLRSLRMRSRNPSFRRVVERILPGGPPEVPADCWAGSCAGPQFTDCEPRAQKSWNARCARTLRLPFIQIVCDLRVCSHTD